MISEGYKSAYQQGYSDTVRDFRKKSKTDVLDKIRAEIADLDDADYDYEGYYKAVAGALKIIDKYKGESEAEE